MPRSRRTLVSLDVTPYYHCISRCVRRAFLCGEDVVSGHSFEHRRQWIVDRLGVLCSVFSIQVCAYAVMSNHYHLVLCCNPSAVDSIDDPELVARLRRIWKIPLFVTRFMGGSASSGEARLASVWLAERRQRLHSLSWFMACLNEWVARKANLEDNCTGRFWEGRFRSQALTDEKALLTCMAYVDLNPIRANKADSLEGSDYTSIQSRISCDEAIPLRPLGDNSASDIPISQADYTKLVEWTGKAAVPGKKGRITRGVERTLAQMGHDAHSWRLGMRLFGTRRYAVIGPVDQIRRFATAIGKNWLHGLAENQAVFKTA